MASISSKEEVNNALGLPVQFEQLPASSVVNESCDLSSMESTKSPQQTSRQSITLLIPEKEYRRWRHIGQECGLMEEMDIAVFLINFYEKHKGAVDLRATCTMCQTPLPMLCRICSATSHQHSSDLQGPSTSTKSIMEREVEPTRNNCLQDAVAMETELPEMSEDDSFAQRKMSCSPDQVDDHSLDVMDDHSLDAVDDHSLVLPSEDRYSTSSELKLSDLASVQSAVPLTQNHSKCSALSGVQQSFDPAERSPSSHHESDSFKSSKDTADGLQISTDSAEHCSLLSRRSSKRTIGKYKEHSFSRGKQKYSTRQDKPQRRSCKEKQKAFQCQSCSASFMKRYNLKQHVASSHKDDSPFTCAQCGQACSHAEELEAHMRSQHTLFDCSECSATFTNDVRFKAHVRTQHPGVKPHQCQHCNKSYTSRQSLLFHTQQVHAASLPQTDGILSSDASGRYHCQACSAVFHRQSLLKVHVASHRSQIRFLCNVCGLPCSGSQDLNHHMLTHKPFECQVCLAKFAHNTKYTAHMRRQHPGVKAHKCPHCDMAFDTRKWLAVHLLKHTGERPHLCPECGKSFTEAQVLQRHRLAMHQGARPYACTKCSKTFKTSSALAYHRRSHGGSKPCLCDECGKTFLCPSALLTHKKKCKVRDQVRDGVGSRNCEAGDRDGTGTDHNPDPASGHRPFACPDCGTTFKGEQWLYRHMVNKPAACTKKFMCEFCPRVFKDNRNFVRHVRVHTGEKPFACSECKANFTTRSDLYRHSRTHSGVKPYACQQCDMWFRFRCDLTTHLRTHSGKTPYCCDHCNSAFISASQRLQHMRSKHKEAVGLNTAAKQTKEKTQLMQSREPCAIPFSSGINHV